ncbi:hybrid cluster protein [Thermoanaerobacter mathranii subsp. mathranii str. A3]|jgi:hydroxylamine reductase|uniref:Hydroxylamine reductase n=2 Tax=Thermoanaerobacter TaxID=1754 RepID=A0ABT9M562_9THEO|nr:MULTISPECIES: hydroxylamine reductase [Thermoanaerobacter]ADH61536.1 hybrid cluster protein [Thermoanaerobacter mathranii subsp. mathranii str. A3]MBT1278636.1 hydroxylamine reductase [Thermoanaerobacter sp. CM-CNRG TB177]MDP9751271.1 hydroxylamine reductase [Thermoanaerobacter pentosaceus]
MSMFCYQCQEASQGIGCTVRGVCGKTDDVANLQDLLVFTLKGISYLNLKAREAGVNKDKTDRFLIEGLFSTITNVNFDKNFFINKIKEAVALREEIKQDLKKAEIEVDESIEAINWVYGTDEDIEAIAREVGVLSTKDEDIRSLRELITYGVKGMAAYAYHAYQLGYKDDNIFRFMEKALAKILDDSLTADDYVALALEAGKFGVDTMALLDKANTSTYGHPEITKVNIGVRNNPGILISGHDLKDLEQLLEQTAGTGVDVYTHGEMLPAHYYPTFKKYPHFVGNYGNAWWKQDKEFELFNGPILMTTNCLVPPKDSYKDRVYTTGVVGFEGAKHIPEGPDGKKDFSEIIEHAKRCKPPVEIERGEIIGGFAHNQVLELADKIVEAVKTGAIKRFFVMAGCDGRMKSRTYYTEFAKALPKDTVILTAGCAKYRYNKLNLGDINGIPRVLDAGQCNDSYSLALIAMKLKEVFGLNDINELPISYNIAWYEQKAVIVLLALLYLGVKNIHLGPTLPAFLSPNVTKVLVDKFGIGGITNVEDDLKMFMGE